MPDTRIEDLNSGSENMKTHGTYHAFISYSHSADRDLARGVEKTLWTFGRKWYELRGVRTYRDETNLAAEPDLWPAIEKAIRESTCLILFASPASAKSAWVPREVAAFVQRRGIRELCIVQTSGVLPWTDALSAKEMGVRTDAALSESVLQLFSDAGIEPLVVDLRPFRDVPERQRLKDPEYLSRVAAIAAKALERDKETIWGYYHRAQRIRTGVLGVASFVLLALAVGLGVALRGEVKQRAIANTEAIRAQTSEHSALVQGRAARDQKQIADDQRGIAEGQRTIADEQKDIANMQRQLAVQREAEAIAQRDRAIVNESNALSALSGAATLQGHYSDAAKLALAAWPRSLKDRRPRLQRTIDALANSTSGYFEVVPRLTHELPVTSIAFSQDGTRLVTGSRDGTARIWDTRSGSQLGATIRHEKYKSIPQVSFSPDGRVVLTASEDQTARVSDGFTGAYTGLSIAHTAQVSTAVFDLSGAHILTASIDGLVRVSDTLTHSGCSRRMVSGELNSAEFSQDGTLVIVAGAANAAYVLSAKTCQQVGPTLSHLIRGPARADLLPAGHGEGLAPPTFTLPLTVAVFSPDGHGVATGSWDKTVQVWDWPSGRSRYPPLLHEGSIESIAFSPDGLRLVTTSAQDNMARVWDARSGHLAYPPLRHGAQVVNASFSPDGLRIVTASGDHTARIWDASTGQQLGPALEHDGPVLAAKFNFDGRRVASASWDGTARLWDVSLGRPLIPTIRYQSMAASGRWNKDATRILTISTDNVVRVWDSQTGKPIGKSMVHASSVSDAEFSPDDTKIVTASDDGTAQIWSATSGERLGPPFRHKRQVSSACFSPDGRKLATASWDNTAQVWDVETGKPLGRPLQHGGIVRKVLFTMDGKSVITASDDQTVQIWDVANSERRGVPMHTGAAVADVCVDSTNQFILVRAIGRWAQVWSLATLQPLGPKLTNPDVLTAANLDRSGKLVVTASRDGTVVVWDNKTGGHMGQPIPSGKQVVQAVEFSPDGLHVVTGSWDHSARMWDINSGRQVGRSLMHQGEVMTATLSPDAQRILTVAADGTARVWSNTWPEGELLMTLCTVLRDHGTEALNARYGTGSIEPVCTVDAHRQGAARLGSKAKP